MSIVDIMAEAIANWQDADEWKEACERHPTDSTGLHREHFMRMARAALRSVKAEDISDGMVEAFRASINSHPVGEITSFEEERRAIAAAIASGAEG